MKFKVLNWVHDPLNGVGRVKSYEKMTVGGETHTFMVVEFSAPNFLARIPCSLLETRGVRSLSTKKALKEALSVFTKSQKKHKMLWSQKTALYEKKLLSGNIHDIAEIVRDLAPPKNPLENEQSYTEHTLYQKAFARLTHEYAHVMGEPQETSEKKISALCG